MVIETQELAQARNIDRTYRELVTPQDLRDGRSWYRKARRTAREIAADAGVSERVAAGVIAALSPRNAWPVNVASARTLLGVGTGKLAGTYANRRKAERIAAGDFSALQGPKVSRFFRNITGDRQAVTVDTWAMRIALDDATYQTAPRESQVQVTERAYQMAAGWHGLDPRDLQAATWIAYRRAHARADFGADFPA